MSELLFHAAQEAALRLSERLRSALAQVEDLRAAPLADRLTAQPHDRPRLVFTGQWSSGKSTLIKALTDGHAEVVIDSDIATDTVTEFDWDGLVVLVDTPGVGSGRDEHDALAEAAISAADLVLFAVTGDLFDDAAVRYLHKVTDTLGKRDQLLLVIAKANAMKAAPGVRETEIRQVLGPMYDAIPSVECDARDYLDGLNHADPARGAAYRELSKMDDLRSAINDISRRRGDLARYQQPFQAIKAVAMEAESLLVQNPDEAAALALLARQRSALAARRQRMDANLNELAAVFRSDSVRAAERFADDVESIEHLPDGAQREQSVAEFTQRLTSGLDAAAARLGEGIARVLERQFDDLAAEVREIESAPHTRIVLNLTNDADITSVQTQVDLGRQTTPPARQHDAATPPWAAHAGKWLTEFQKSWGAGGGVKASAGTIGHKVVLRTGHMFGQKFKPWQAVRVADRIGKAARIGGTVLGVAVQIGSVVAEERAEVKAQQDRARRRNHLLNEVLQQADDIARQALGEIRSQLDDVFTEAYREIDSVHTHIVDTRQHRTSLTHELVDIQRLAQTEWQRLAIDARPVPPTPQGTADA